VAAAGAPGNADLQGEVRLLRRRALITVALSASLLVGPAQSAAAEAKAVQKKRTSGPHGRTGKVSRYVDHNDGGVLNYLKITAKDSDGRKGKCTETWIDYATKPHQHFNPGLLVNCSGKTKTLSKVYRTHYEGIRGVQIVVCEVPKTSGRITRNGKNCRGNLSGIYLRSGRRYKDFGVDAIQRPGGVKIWRT
jgi:hypothetical protein